MLAVLPPYDFFLIKINNATCMIWMMKDMVKETTVHSHMKRQLELFTYFYFGDIILLFSARAILQ